MTNPFDEHAALDDLLAELFGEQIIVAIENVEMMEEEHVEEGNELDQVAS